MIEDQTTILIRDLYFEDAVGIAIFKYIGGKKYIAKPISFEYELIDEMAIIIPTIKLPSRQAEEFMKGLASALDSEGIKTDNDFKIKGLLEAKDSHLQDMRKLVFNNDKELNET